MSRQIETNIAVQFSNRNRMTAFFRIFAAIPATIFVDSFGNLMSSDSFRSFGHGTQGSPGRWMFASGLLMAPAFLAILFRGKYPTYVYSFNQALLGLQTRVNSYVFLLVDSYPSIEASESVEVVFPEISTERPLNRWLPLVKWFLAIPLYIAGLIYGIYAFFLTIFAWFAILFTGEYPAWCARPVAGVIAFWNRIEGYAFLLVTDEYPSLSL